MNTVRSSNLNDFDTISISIASPELIKTWAKQSACRHITDGIIPGTVPDCSCSEVKKPETINYRTFRPEKDGLFCEIIFGTTKDWECQCGKYKRIKHRGTICDRCGVEVTQQKVRRERMGYIELAAPVSHIWFFKGLPSRIGLFLDLMLREVERILYFESYIVLEVDEGLPPILSEETDQRIEPPTVRQVLSEDEYQKYKEFYPTGWRADMGAAAIRELLEQIDLDREAEKLRAELAQTGSKQKAKKLTKRLQLVNGFQNSGNRPEWLILTVIPVVPPDLRPLVALDGGRFATSDLNDLYRRVINRNNRLKRLMDLRAPEIIIRNEKRMLQEAVDALLDNGKHGRTVRGPGTRPLKSLSDMLKGKGGRFRQNLLGKRVDYSGRSVVVVGPELELHQCGLPKEMAIELFKPFIIHKLQDQGYAPTIKKAKSMTEKVEPEVWDVLEEVIQDHPVLLNRAPTLHRLGIQAFEPQLVEGRAIRIHPLVCGAFNADFDGDQMAVHVPLGPEAQVEAKLLMMATSNILKPAHGGPIAVPELDIVLGCSFLTKSVPEANRPPMNKGPKYFDNHDEVLLAHGSDQLHLHDTVDLHFKETNGTPVRTTVGRVIFNQIVPDELKFVDQETNISVPFINQEMHAPDLSQLVSRCFEELGNRRTVEFLHELKQLGFHYATLSGISIGIDDMIIPAEKERLIQEAWEEVQEIESDFSRGEISPGERYNKIINVWLDRIDQIEDALFSELEKGREHEIEGFSPIHIMADSGARSKKSSLRQISGLRGLMAKPSGEIIEHPIESCFREGLSVLEYFTSTHGARKGLADTAIKTASSGYLTRKLVDVAQDVMITMNDCYTSGYIVKSAGEEAEVKISAQIVGRTFAGVIDQETDRVISTVIHNENGEILVTQDQLINRNLAEQIEQHGYTRIAVRSPLSCEAPQGICAKCYGTDLSTGQPVDLGEAVGIIAAQSIGEPGTQLTMRTFHTGGTATGDVIESQVTASNAGKVRYSRVEFVDRSIIGEVGKPLTEDLLNSEGEVIAHIGDSITQEIFERHQERVVLSKQNAELQIVNPETTVILERHDLPVGTRLFVEEEEIVAAGQSLSEFDPYRIPILTKQPGTVVFQNIVEGRTVREDKTSGLAERVIIEYKGDAPPRIDIQANDGEIIGSYLMPVGAHLSIADGEKVKEGFTLARLPKEAAKSSDIVSGLPRITELFEARKPKDAAFIAEIDGLVQLQGISRGMHILKIVNPETGVESKSARIPVGKYLLVDEGDEVKTGDALTDGPINPHDILESKGLEDVQAYLIDEVQTVYRSQGERINDKHVEVIIHQMLDKVTITDTGETELLEEEEISRTRFEAINERARSGYIVKSSGIEVGDQPTEDLRNSEGEVIAPAGDTITQEHLDQIAGLEDEGTIATQIDGRTFVGAVNQDGEQELVLQLESPDGDVLLSQGELIEREMAMQIEQMGYTKIAVRPALAQAKPLLQGITKASLSTDSFISAASFQQTTSVLTKAAIVGKSDYLKGLKENVIMGHLIPAGTGVTNHRMVETYVEGEDAESVELADDLSTIIRSVESIETDEVPAKIGVSEEGS